MVDILKSKSGISHPLTQIVFVKQQRHPMVNVCNRGICYGCQDYILYSTIGARIIIEVLATGSDE